MVLLGNILFFSFVGSYYLIFFVLEAFQEITDLNAPVLVCHNLKKTVFTSCNVSRGFECIHLTAFMRGYG